MTQQFFALNWCIEPPPSRSPLVAGLVAVFGGGMPDGPSGMRVPLAIAAVMSVALRFNSGTMALKADQATIISRDQAPDLSEPMGPLRQRVGLRI